MYRFIIKAARPAIFIRFAHTYVLVPNMYNYVKLNLGHYRNELTQKKVCVFFSKSGSKNPSASDILNNS